jgi:hypothetical protein
VLRRRRSRSERRGFSRLIAPAPTGAERPQRLDVAAASVPARQELRAPRGRAGVSHTCARGAVAKRDAVFATFERKRWLRGGKLEYHLQVERDVVGVGQEDARRHRLVWDSGGRGRRVGRIGGVRGRARRVHVEAAAAAEGLERAELLEPRALSPPRPGRDPRARRSPRYKARKACPARVPRAHGSAPGS